MCKRLMGLGRIPVKDEGHGQEMQADCSGGEEERVRAGQNSNSSAAVLEGCS